MEIPLISTKISAPPLRRMLVARPDLINKLNQGVENGFVLISAPAGYGKTTLLSAWLDQVKYSYAWISLDTSDNDLVRFLSYLATALGKVDLSYSEIIKDSLLHKPKLDINSLLSRLINQLARSKQRLCLILDDYHVIQEQAVHQAIGFLLEHRPEQFQLIIATRTDPPLPLNQYRAHSRIFEFRLADLRFSTTETEDFLASILGVNLSQEDLSILETSTEGWIAALQMAGLSLQNREDISIYLRSVSGENRYSLEFLFEEIFKRQTEDIQNFLLQSSIVERLSAPLCDHLLMRQDSESILEILDRNNLFLIALDEKREWYRYHYLFQTLLQQQSKHLQKTSISAIHIRASEWYEQMGRLPQAINHALESKNYDLSARLIEQSADITLLNGEIKTFLGWVERMPKEIACQRPLLCVYHAEALLLTGKPMDQVAKCLEGTPEYAAMEALRATYQGNIELSKRLSAQALENLPTDSYFLRSVITSALGAIQLLGGDIEPAISTFYQSAAIGKKSGNLLFEVIALCRLGQLFLMKGVLHKAEDFIRQALEISKFRPGAYISVASMALMTLANLKYELNELDQALEYIEDAVELTDNTGGFWSVDCYLVYADVLQAQGRSADALDAMSKARKISSQTQANRFDDIYSAAYQAQLHISQGNLAEANRWARSGAFAQWEVTETPGHHDPYNPVLFHLTELEYITLAKVYLAYEDPQKAQGLLLPLFSETEKRGRTLSLVENLVLQALANHISEKADEALKKLEEALLLAEPAGFVRVFLNEGASLEVLLIKLAACWERDRKKGLARTKIQEDYLQRLLFAFATTPMPAKSANPSHRRAMPGTSLLLEPLSKRECEVMAQLAEGFSNKEISQNLTIASGTVHKHLKNIYSKLDVHNRTAAVTRARELGII